MNEPVGIAGKINPHVCAAKIIDLRLGDIDRKVPVALGEFDIFVEPISGQVVWTLSSVSLFEAIQLASVFSSVTAALTT